MSATDQRDVRSLHKRTAVRTAVFYVILSGLWIYFSDTLLAWLFTDPAQLTQAQTFKGLFFVVVTAILLYLYLSYCLQVQRNFEEAIEEEQDKAQQDVWERFKQLSTLFDSMNAVVYVADFSTYELLYVNRFAEEFFGQDWRGRRCYHYLQEGINHPCDFCTNSRLTINGEPGDPVVWEFLNTKNNRWYECFDNAIRWTDGRLVRLEVALDITERKELEKIKDDLLSTMSHEMRTPLTAISGFAELLLNEPEFPEQQRRHVEIIYNEAEKLAELINRFLDVRRLKFDRTRVNYEHLPVLNILEKAKKSCRDCKAHHHIKIECQTDVQVYGNRQELTQVITQLLENACRYSPEGGEISLSARSSDRETSIRVADQGLGIPKHELESIFNPFHRLDTGNSRSTGGVGLGLGLAKEIVILHGGQIKIESTPNKGSTFTVLLPQPVIRDNTLPNGRENNLGANTSGTRQS
jgi:two-component system phosphate regulon sensor histidine kinase PhoR